MNPGSKMFPTAARTPPLGLLLCLVAFGCEVDQFLPGFRSDPDARRQTFYQAEPVPVDLLWVVDPSCSMEDEQRRLVDNFPSFIEFFRDSELEFHLGVTSTDIGEDDSPDSLDGHLAGEPAVLTEQTEDLEQAFLDRALMGILPGHSDERALQASYTALADLSGSGEPNAGFLQEGANLSVIVVSDEPDYSTLSAPDSADYIGWEAWSQWLDNFRGGADSSALSGIVGIGPGGLDDPNGCGELADPENGSWNGAKRGDGYIEAIQATGGIAQSICEEDWQELLTRLGLRVAGLLDSFPLSEAPIAESIQVYVDGVRRTDWTYDAELNAILFPTADSIPRPSAEIEVIYDAARP